MNATSAPRRRGASFRGATQSALLAAVCLLLPSAAFAQSTKEARRPNARSSAPKPIAQNTAALALKEIEGSESDRNHGPETDLKTIAKTDLETGLKTVPETGPEADLKTGPETISETALENDPATAQQTDQKFAQESDPKADPEANPETALDTAQKTTSETTSSSPAQNAQNAQDDPNTPEDFDDFDDLDFELPGLQSRVRARRPIRSASEHVVDKEILSAAPKTGATDVLRMVPGLVASKHGGEGKSHQLFLRGFDAVHGQDIELNVGGIPVNEVSHVHALGHADTNFLIPEAVLEVSVHEGSHRAFQGDYAIAGTVDMKLGMSRPGFLIAPTLGSFGLQRMVLGWGQKGNEETFIALEGARANGFGPERAHQRLAGLGQLKLDLKSGTLRLLGGSYGTQFDSPGALREDAIDLVDSGFYGIHTDGQGGGATRHQALAEYSHDWNNGSQSTATAWGLRSTQDLRYNFTGYRSDPRGDGLEQLTETWSFGAQLRHRHPFRLLGRQLVLHSGLGFRHDIIDQAQNGYAESDGSVYRHDLSALIHQTHLFAHSEAVWLLGDWSLRLGGRLDGLVLDVLDRITVPRRMGIENPAHHRDTAGLRAGLKAGISRALGEKWRIFADYGDGFRTPQARSLSQSERTPFIAAHGGELGARYESQKLAASLSGFGTYVADDFFFDHALGTTWHTGATMRGGVQGTVASNPIKGLHLAGHLTWAHAVILETGHQLAYFAPLVGRFDGAWEKPFEVFGQTFTGHIGLAFTGLGPRPMLYGDFSHPVFLADSRLALGWRFVTLRLDVTNLLGSEWRDGEYAFASKFDEGGSLLPARHFTAGNPRTFWATLEFRL